MGRSERLQGLKSRLEGRSGPKVPSEADWTRWETELDLTPADLDAWTDLVRGQADLAAAAWDEAPSPEALALWRQTLLWAGRDRRALEGAVRDLLGLSVPKGQRDPGLKPLRAWAQKRLASLGGPSAPAARAPSPSTPGPSAPGPRTNRAAAEPAPASAPSVPLVAGLQALAGRFVQTWRSRRDLRLTLAALAALVLLAGLTGTALALQPWTWFARPRELAADPGRPAEGESRALSLSLDRAEAVGPDLALSGLEARLYGGERPRLEVRGLLTSPRPLGRLSLRLQLRDLAGAFSGQWTEGLEDPAGLAGPGVTRPLSFTQALGTEPANRAAHLHLTLLEEGPAPAWRRLSRRLEFSPAPRLGPELRPGLHLIEETWTPGFQVWRHETLIELANEGLSPLRSVELEFRWVWQGQTIQVETRPVLGAADPPLQAAERRRFSLDTLFSSELYGLTGEAQPRLEVSLKEAR